VNRDNLFCTLAIGEKYRELARFLCRDFAVYGQKIFIVTDDVSDFKSEKNAICVDHKPAKFSFHDKKIALRKALEIAPTAIFVDADTCMHFFSDRRAVAVALGHGFAPGIHVSKMYPEGLWSYPEVEQFAQERGMNFSRNVITYWEGLFAITRHPALEQFFENWDLFHQEADQRGHNGAGEGTCIAIAAEAAGLPRHYTNEMMQSNLPGVLWHTRGLSTRLRKLHHFKFGATEILKGNLNFRMHCWALR
jgi:hypothetical protein